MRYTDVYLISDCRKSQIERWPPLTRGLSALLTGGENPKSNQDM